MKKVLKGLLAFLDILFGIICFWSALGLFLTISLILILWSSEAFAIMFRSFIGFVISAAWLIPRAARRA